MRKRSPAVQRRYPFELFENALEHNPAILQLRAKIRHVGVMDLFGQFSQAIP